MIAITVGILLAVAGFEHGLFEALQGDTSTGGFFIDAIGKSMQWWEHGSEGAFTIVHNFLATGILAMSTGVLIVLWSLAFLHRRRGAAVFLLLFVLLTLFGGGIGFIPFYVVTWAYATRIDKNLDWWRRRLPEKVRARLARMWPYTLAATALCWLTAVEIAIWGYLPFIKGQDTLLAVCWSLLLASMVLINLSFVSGFARDIERHPSNAQ